jgi:cysteine desulfurase
MVYFDNNACVPMTDAILQQYAIGAKLGNISNESSAANRGQFCMEQLTRNLHSMFPNTKIVYTSGGTESNSTILSHYGTGHYICPMSEHWSLIAKVKDADVTWIRPHPSGHVSIAEMLAAVKPSTKLIILQSVNSETGAVQNLMSLATGNSRQIPIHCDHVQGFMKLPEITSFVNYCNRTRQLLSLSISFHKIGAPLGFGALITNYDFHPLIAGSQNGGFRGGTYNISAMYASVQAMKDYSYDKVRGLRATFDSEIAKHFVVINYPMLAGMVDSGAKLSSSGYLVLFGCDKCLPHTIFMAIGHDNEIMCNKIVRDALSRKNITVGYGSACNTGKVDPLGSMRSANIPEALKNGFIRISISCYNTTSEIKKLTNALSTLL